MTNFEKFKDELARVALESNSVAVVTGKPRICDDITCEECDFFRVEEYHTCGVSCHTLVRKWAGFAYKEPVKLNEQERLFCEMVENGYLARDKAEALYWYNKKPQKGNATWKNSADAFVNLGVNKFLKRLFKDGLHFNFIKWEDEEPWSVKELLERCKG